MKKILIVDDQRGIRMLLDEVFSREGFKTYLAAKGSEALQLIERENIDCVLLDLNLSGEDGRDILKKIKTILPEIPVFIMTAFNEEGMVKETELIGAEHFFTKPFNIFELKETVEKVLLN